MIKYDSSTIQALAHQLSRRADFIVIFYGVIGLILGCIIGYGTFLVAGYKGDGGTIGAIIGFFIGNEIGLSKALLYKFQAQMLLDSS